MATKGAVQATKTGRNTSGGDSLLHLWRIRNFMTQGKCAFLLGVCDTTIQRWDAHEGSEPALLEPALAYHGMMLAEVATIKARWDARDVISLADSGLRDLDLDGILEALRKDARSMMLADNIENLDPCPKLAILYGIERGLFRLGPRTF